MFYIGMKGGFLLWEKDMNYRYLEYSAEGNI
jgi:hypothetical protein